MWLPLTDLLLAVEIVSPGSALMDEAVKVREYAAAGIPRYWLVEWDTAQTVSIHVLGQDGTYEVVDKKPVSWLLRSEPGEHGMSR